MLELLVARNLIPKDYLIFNTSASWELHVTKRAVVCYFYFFLSLASFKECGKYEDSLTNSIYSGKNTPALVGILAFSSDILPLPIFQLYLQC